MRVFYNPNMISAEFAKKMRTLYKIINVEKMTNYDFIDVPVRVKYADTDKFGIVYYGNYAIFFEKARTEYLRKKGFTYKELEEKGYHLPVVEFYIKYFKPAMYDDLLIIRTFLEEIKSRAVVFKYEVLKEGEKIAEGKTYHICVNRDNKTVALPSFFVSFFKR